MILEYEVLNLIGVNIDFFKGEEFGFLGNVENVFFSLVFVVDDKGKEGMNDKGKVINVLNISIMEVKLKFWVVIVS